MNLRSLLVDRGLLHEPDLTAAEARHAESGSSLPLDEWLVEQGLLPEGDWLHLLADAYGIPYLGDLAASLDPPLVAHVSVDWARQHVALPIRLADGIRVAIAHPGQATAADDLSLLLGDEVGLAFAPRQVVLAAIDECYFRHAPEEDGGRPASDAPEAGAEVSPPGADDLLREGDDAPVTRFVNRMLLDAVRQGASDIHIEPFEGVLRVRFRVDGFLREVKAPAKAMEAALVSRIKIMSRLDISERRLPQDGMAKVRAGDREVDIRVSTVPVAAGERLVLRLLNQQTSLLPLDELGMPAPVLGALRAGLARPGGMILVTGPTGSGKTTTLYSAIQELDRVRMNILTIEDPVEYQLPDIGQIQVRPKLGLTFAEGLRHILRQDPDIILVGEIRDRETADIAVRAALTGHLVLSTLHTNDAPSALVRLADIGIQPYLIASALYGVIAQRLVRTVAPPGGTPEEDSGQDGYAGRTGIYEWFEVTEEVRQTLRSGVVETDRLRTLHARQAGGRLREDAEAKIRDGRTTEEEVRRVLGVPSAGPAA